MNKIVYKILGTLLCSSYVLLMSGVFANISELIISGFILIIIISFVSICFLAHVSKNDQPLKIIEIT